MATAPRRSAPTLPVPDIEGILLAAGESRRMGYPKPLLRVGDESFLARSVNSLLAFAPRLIIVLGAHAERIRPAIPADSRIRVVENHRWQAGQLSSLKTGLGAILVVLIMLMGSLVLWVGAPLLWIWLGSQIEGATSSVGASIGAAFLGAVLTITVVAMVLSKLSNVYRANRRSRGLDDTGHFVLEVVLVISAGIALAAFVVWFFFLAGAEPLPIGIGG